jgi:hypothetical protein
MSLSARRVTTILFRVYRPVLFWSLGVIVVACALLMAIISSFTAPQFSLWLLVFGSATDYWLLVVGVMLVSVHLRQFVSNGVTRRAFVGGAAAFGAALAVAFAVLVPLGHGVESASVHAAAAPGTDYPAFSGSIALREFGHALPGELAYLVSGLAIAAAFYRYGPWPGILLLLPGALPIAVTQGFLGADENGRVDTRVLPYAAAVLLSLAVTALVAALYQRQMRDVAIRRTAG